MRSRAIYCDKTQIDGVNGREGMQPGEVVAGAGALEDAHTRDAHPGWPPAPPHGDRALSTYNPEQQRRNVGAAARVRSRTEWGSIASCLPARRYQATTVQAHAGAAEHARGSSRGWKMHAEA